MNDVEDMLREELRVRVDAADAQRPDGAPRLSDIEARVRRVRLRRRWTGAALSAVAVAAATALPLALLSAGAAHRGGPGTLRPGVPLTDTAATPRGWATVAYGDAQISVPARWRISSRLVCGRAAPGYVVLGTAATSLDVQNARCKQPPDMAAILRHPGGPKHAGGSGIFINGIAVVPVLTGAPAGSMSYYVPALHVTVTARGPLARLVLATLTRSPLSVVLAPGPALKVPSGWRWHRFGGIRFATPGTWRVVRSRFWYPCWNVVYPTQSVKLVTATRRALTNCNAPLDIAGFMQPGRGVVVGFGQYVGLYDPRHEIGCRQVRGLRACLYWPSVGRPLELAVYIPGRREPTVVDVGLRGNGLEARVIVESIGPA